MISGQRYDTLKGKRPVQQKEYYEGIFQNKPVLFDRHFREYRFTDAECKALCDGEWLEVHNLQNGAILYGVQGHLQQDIFASAKSSIPIYVFKSTSSLLHNPSYSFENRTPYFGPNPANFQNTNMSSQQSIHINHNTGEPKKPTVILHESVLDEFSDEEDSKLAAMIAAPELPEIVEVKTNENNIKIFVPVIAGYRYTKYGLEMMPDEEQTIKKSVVQSDSKEPMSIFVPKVVKVQEQNSEVHNKSDVASIEKSVVSKQVVLDKQSEVEQNNVDNVEYVDGVDNIDNIDNIDNVDDMNHTNQEDNQDRILSYEEYISNTALVEGVDDLYDDADKEAYEEGFDEEFEEELDLDEDFSNILPFND